VNRAGSRADTPEVPYTTDGPPYFVNLDAPSAPSRTTPLGREARYAEDGRSPLPVHKPRKRKLRIRPAWIFVIAAASWFGWAYTTPGGPSARIGGWIDHTRGVVSEASVNPDLRRNAQYFNGLYEAQGKYPNLPDSEIQSSPGFTLNESLVYCSTRAIVLQSLSAATKVSRLLLDGQDLGNVSNQVDCPRNLSDPAPWNLPKK
jgi:hypothetical protein